MSAMLQILFVTTIDSLAIKEGLQLHLSACPFSALGAALARALQPLVSHAQADSCIG